MHKHFKSHSWPPTRGGKCSFLKMKLVAEILIGTLFYVEVGEDATVGDLKKQIGRQEQLPTDRLILMLDVNANERPLLDKDWVSLKDYGVQDGSHIYIFFQPLNDSPPSSTHQDSASNAPYAVRNLPPDATESSSPSSLSSDDKEV